ncbi:MAG: DUF4249 domain-containing protein [Bacteroidota bacterium]
MKIPGIYFLVSGLMILASCEKLATNVDTPKVSAELVLFSFISPEDAYTKVRLTLSKPVFGPQNGGSNPYNYVKDAMVILTNDGGQSAILVYADSVEGYVVDNNTFPVEASRTYTVTAVSGSRKVTASCTVPSDTIGFSDITYKKTGEAGRTDGPLYRYQYKWNDAASKVNYYRAVSQYSYEFAPGMNYSQEICTSLTTDAGRDGGVLSGTCEDYSNYYEGDTAHNRVSFYLLNTDIHYYEYHRRRLEYFGDDPFSEPFPQYTNVNGGLGVFCSYRKSMRTIKIN